MISDPSTAARIEAALLPLGPVMARRMFGGYGVFLDGLMFALIAEDRLFLKVDDQSKPRFAEAGSQPFVYEGKRRPVEMSYWLLPDAAAGDPEALVEWARIALAAARRAKAAKAEKKRSGRKDRA